MKTNVKIIYIKRRDGVPYKEVEGELLLLNLKDGNYFGLNSTGKYVWQLLDVAKTQADIVNAFKRKFKIKEEIAQRDISHLLRELKKQDLIQVISSARKSCQRIPRKSAKKTRVR